MKYPPGTYIVTFIASKVDDPNDTITTTVTLTLADPCDIPVSVDSITPQTLYVGGPQVTLQASSSTVLASNCPSFAYALSDTTQTWMGIDSTGLVTLLVTDPSLRGTHS